MTREEAKAEVNLSILSSWEQHFDQDAKDAIQRMEMIIDRIYDEFQGDFKEPMERESLAKRTSRLIREKRGVYGDTRGQKRVRIKQVNLCPLVLKTFNINDGFIGHLVQPRQ